MTAQKTPKMRTISMILRDIAKKWDKETITLEELLHEIGPRSFGLIIFILALPNILPVSIPGISTVLGLVIVILSLQLILNYPEPILPRFIAHKEIPFKPFAKILRRLLRTVRKTERLLKPRWPMLSDNRSRKVISLLLIILSLSMMLPIPLGNPPPAIALMILSAGLIERDGICITIGLIASIVALVIIAFMSLAYASAVWLLFTKLIG
ncbi:MAG: exopolysaccharide biosynthesis protein [Alphaproteobacteria bacterium]